LRLVALRQAGTGINYRRFFAISTLAGLRVEDPEVFDRTQEEVLRWYAAGDLDGIRVDHPDGLRDPTGYLRRLHAAAPDAWLVVEKILEPGEELPRTWPVAGTTGYDSLREVCGLFVDPAAERAFAVLDAELTAATTDPGPAGQAAVPAGTDQIPPAGMEPAPAGTDAAPAQVDEVPRAGRGRAAAGPDGVPAEVDEVPSAAVEPGPAGWAEVAHRAKLGAATVLLRAELDRLDRLAGGGCRDALAELLACFEV